NPSHPIAEGVPHPIGIDEQARYGEHFDSPVPGELVFVSSFSGGEGFRSGFTFRSGTGKIFYFSTGDQDYHYYYHRDVRRVRTDWFLTGSGGQGLGDAEAAGKGA